MEIILDGKVSIERISEAGELLTITNFEEGDILGGNIVFASNPYYLMNVTTLEKTSILEINKDILFNLLSSNNEFLRAFLEFISDTTSILGNKIKHHIKTSLRTSIINFLKQEYIKQHSHTIRLPFTKKELAERLGCERTSLSRELTKMKNDKIIDYNKDLITVIDTSILD